MAFKLKWITKMGDEGWQRVLKDIGDLRGTYVKVGVLGEDAAQIHEGSQMTTAKLATIHEFGAPAAGIPERSFVRATFNGNKRLYVAMLRQTLGALFEKSGRIAVFRAIGLVGAKMAADMKGTIRKGIPPPNAPATLRRKLAKGRGRRGSPVPLIDTGRLLNSISWLVVRSGAVKDAGHPSPEE